MFGDDIAILAQTLVMDAADPADVGRTMVASATAGHPPEEHAEMFGLQDELLAAWRQR